MMAGFVYSRPPLTMRWPTAAISDLSDIARAAPELNASSKRAVASWRVPAVISSLCFVPEELLISSAARSPCHSIFPSHNGSGGDSGKGAPSSYSDDFWLLEPELRTRIFTQYGHFQSRISGTSSPCS